MGVFPAASRSHVPAPWGELMLDPVSENQMVELWPDVFVAIFMFIIFFRNHQSLTFIQRIFR